MADAVQFLGSPKKASGPDGGVAESDDKPAVGAYRREGQLNPTGAAAQPGWLPLPPPERGLR